MLLKAFAIAIHNAQCANALQCNEKFYKSPLNCTLFILFLFLCFFFFFFFSLHSYLSDRQWLSKYVPIQKRRLQSFTVSVCVYVLIPTIVRLNKVQMFYCWPLVLLLLLLLLLLQYTWLLRCWSVEKFFKYSTECI